MYKLLNIVSIHAPVWGATNADVTPINEWASFNPRSRMGSDQSRNGLVGILRQFQSTLPYGERLKGHGKIGESKVSIHAPVWGATIPRLRLQRHQRVSIHAPVWGATKSRKSQKVIRLFQSTLPYGERPRPVPHDSFC